MTIGAINESEESFNILFHHNPEPMWIFEPQSLSFLEVNNAAIKKYGYSRDEFFNMTILDIRPAEDWAKLKEHVKTLTGANISRREYRHHLKNGETIYVNINSFPVSFRQKLARIVQVADVTEKVMMSKLSKTITDNATPALFMVDKSGSCTFMNPAAKKIFGYTFEEISANSMFLHNALHHHYPNGEYYPAEACPLYLAMLNKQELVGHEDVFFNKDGSSIPVLCTVCPIFEDGKHVSTVIEVLDITRQKKLEQEQQLAQKNIEELMLKKDEFMSIASHELKTPLTSIKAYTQLLEKNIPPGVKAYTFIQKTGQHINRLEKLIADLLDVSKINAGKLTYNITEVNFADILAESVESVQHTAPYHRIVIEKSANVFFKGDRLRLEQVLNNFLTNAIKYSPNEDKVIVRSEIHQHNLVVSIQDFGIGIAPENLNKLFDRFYRVDNTAMRYQGLGLGLYIAAEIIKRHNGSFWIESEPGKGSTFYFLLPLNTESAASAHVSSIYLHSDDGIKISYNTSNRWLEVDWMGFHNLNSVKRGCLIMLNLLKKNNCSKVLNDNRHLKGTWSEAAEWLSKEWFPQMEEAGLKYFAWTYSPSTFSRMATNKTMESANGNVNTKAFESKAEAEEWLSEMQ